MSIKGYHFVWLLWQNVKVGNLMMHQQGKKTCEAPAGKEDPAELVSCPFFSSGSHFVQPSGNILAILVKRYKRNISVKLF